MAQAEASIARNCVQLRATELRLETLVITQIIIIKNLNKQAFIYSAIQ